MRRPTFRTLVAVAVFSASMAVVDAQNRQTSQPLLAGAIATTPCSGAPLFPPAALPPPGSHPFIWIIDLCFARQGGTSKTEPEIYLGLTQLRASRPSERQFVPWDEEAERRTLADRRNLIETAGLIEDMAIQVDEHTFPNGAVGVIVTYDMRERDRPAGAR